MTGRGSRRPRDLPSVAGHLADGPVDVTMPRDVPWGRPTSCRTVNPPRRSPAMATYRMVYGGEDEKVTQTLEGITSIEREDGWFVHFRGPKAILRLQEKHVHSLDWVDSGG